MLACKGISLTVDELRSNSTISDKVKERLLQNYPCETDMDEAVGSISDRALLMDYRACCEKKPDKAIKLAKDAVAMLTEITSDNALLAANLHANLGGMYRQSEKYELAKLHMEQGIQLLEQVGLVPYHDSIPQITNYAVLLTEMVFEAEQEMIEAKKQELLGTYTKAGLYLGQKIFK